MSYVLIKEKSATRVDLAGGTLDLWPLSALIPGATTLNCAIDCYTSVEYEEKSESEGLEIHVKSPDFEEYFILKNKEELRKAQDQKLSLLKSAFPLLKDQNLGFGVWRINSESPAGSGLGGSSSLMISILKVIFKLNKWSLDESKLIECAKNAETEVLSSPAGIQDYFSPIQKGLNLITFEKEGHKRISLDEKILDFWSSCFTIVDSEIKHHSGMNNWEILKDYIDGVKSTVGALNDISFVAQKTSNALLNKSIADLKSCFDQELAARIQVSESYVNEELQVFLDKLSGLSSDIQALKVCGAGGGGCVLVLHSPDKKEKIVQDLIQNNICVLPFKLI